MLQQLQAKWRSWREQRRVEGAERVLHKTEAHLVDVQRADSGKLERGSAPSAGTGSP